MTAVEHSQNVIIAFTTFLFTIFTDSSFSSPFFFTNTPIKIISIETLIIIVLLRLKRFVGNPRISLQCNFELRKKNSEGRGSKLRREGEVVRCKELHKNRQILES